MRGKNALHHFGGAPLLLNIGNLKAAVLKADWFDPHINPKLAEFCRHYRLTSSLSSTGASTQG